MTLEEFLERTRRIQKLREKGMVATFTPLSGLRATCRTCRTRPAEGIVRFVEFGRRVGKGYRCRFCWEHTRTEQGRGSRCRYIEGPPLILHPCQKPKEQSPV